MEEAKPKFDERLAAEAEIVAKEEKKKKDEREMKERMEQTFDWYSYEYTFRPGLKQKLLHVTPRRPTPLWDLDDDMEFYERKRESSGGPLVSVLDLTYDEEDTIQKRRKGVLEPEWEKLQEETENQESSSESSETDEELPPGLVLYSDCDTDEETRERIKSEERNLAAQSANERRLAAMERKRKKPSSTEERPAVDRKHFKFEYTTSGGSSKMDVEGEEGEDGGEEGDDEEEVMIAVPAHESKEGVVTDWLGGGDDDDGNAGGDEQEEEFDLFGLKEKRRREKARSLLGLDGEEKKTKSILDNESSDSEDDLFNVRPEFEGKYGAELLRLQQSYGGDSRFRLDHRFTDDFQENGRGERIQNDEFTGGMLSDAEEEEEQVEYEPTSKKSAADLEAEALELQTEKEKYMELLDEVCPSRHKRFAPKSAPAASTTGAPGSSLSSVHPSRDRMVNGPVWKAVQRFDPSTMKSLPKSTRSKEESEKTKNKKAKKAEEEAKEAALTMASNLPEVSDERHFQTNSYLRGLFYEAAKKEKEEAERKRLADEKQEAEDEEERQKASSSDGSFSFGFMAGGDSKPETTTPTPTAGSTFSFNFSAPTNPVSSKSGLSGGVKRDFRAGFGRGLETTLGSSSESESGEEDEEEGDEEEEEEEEEKQVMKKTVVKKTEEKGKKKEKRTDMPNIAQVTPSLSKTTSSADSMAAMASMFMRNSDEDAMEKKWRELRSNATKDFQTKRRMAIRKKGKRGGRRNR